MKDFRTIHIWKEDHDVLKKESERTLIKMAALFHRTMKTVFPNEYEPK